MARGPSSEARCIPVSRGGYWGRGTHTPAPEFELGGRRDGGARMIVSETYECNHFADAEIDRRKSISHLNKPRNDGATVSAVATSLRIGRWLPELPKIVEACSHRLGVQLPSRIPDDSPGHHDICYLCKAGTGLINFQSFRGEWGVGSHPNTSATEAGRSLGARCRNGYPQERRRTRSSLPR